MSRSMQGDAVLLKDTDFDTHILKDIRCVDKYVETLLSKFLFNSEFSLW